jgi:hypothetical protein
MTIKEYYTNVTKNQGTYPQHLILFVTYERVKKARVFGTGNPFKPNEM